MLTNIANKTFKISSNALKSNKAKSTLVSSQKRGIFYLNRATMIGFVGNTPDVKQFANGTSLTSFSLAVNEVFGNREGERVERTNWFKVVISNDRAQDFVQKNVSKGSRVYVDGSIQIKKWTDSVGLERTAVELSVRNRGEVGLLYKNEMNEETSNEGNQNAKKSQEDEDYH